MKKIQVKKTDVIKYCNNCGKEIPFKYDTCFGVGEEFQIDWGYFSAKDGERHTFCLCEECYDRMVSAFKIPVTIEEKTELI